MATLHIDFEGRSTLNLEDVGVDLWTRHHTTDVWCMAYAFDDEPPQLWTPKESAIDIFILESRPGVRLAAHNSQFEIAVWNHIMVPRHKWPRLDPSRLDCTMCMGYAMALPGKLDNLSAALGIQERKDMAGNRLAIQMSRPRAVDEFGCPEWWDDAERLAKLYDYCKQDVVVEREVHKRLLRLNPDEQKLWVVDHQINQRGMAVDIPAIQAALNVVEVEQSRLAKELDALTNGAVDFPSRVRALGEWVKVQAESAGYILDSESLAKQEVIDMLNRDDGLPAHIRRALEIRQEYAKTSVAKLRKMLESVSPDGRLKYILQYHAAGTGRWGGRRIQPQNMPRPKMKPEMIASIIDFMTRLTPQETIERMELVYGAPMNMISECLRGMLRAAPGYVLLAGDYANIEGRGIAWLAGEEWKLQAFRDYDAGIGHDIYLLTAAKIYHTTPTAYTKSSPERQIGKVAELACLGAETQVLTSHGIKAILDVTTEDRVWDGQQWVQHDGLIPRGLRHTTNLLGLTLTPDHLVLTGAMWSPAHQLVTCENTRSLALATGSENLPSPDLAAVPRAGSPRWCGWGARVARCLIKSMTTISEKDEARAVTFAPKSKPGIIGNSFGGTPILCRQTIIGGGYLTAYPLALIDAIIPRTPGTETTGDAESTSTPLGEQIGARFSSILSNFRGGIKQTWNWIEKTWIKGTRRITFNLSLKVRTQKTGDSSKLCSGTSSNLKPVYDLANAGPLHRFTILSSDGPLLVHNCGYQGGVGAFQTMAHTYGVKVPDDQAKNIVGQWREAHPKIQQFWWDLERAAIEAVAHPGLITSAGPRNIRFKVNGSFLWCLLPSHRALCYPYPCLKIRMTPWGEEKEQLHYKAVDDRTKQWTETHTYGGKLAENITQAISRDILAHSIMQVADHAYPIVLHVHDEIVAEIPTPGNIPDVLDQFIQVMKIQPDWSAGLPIAIEGWSGTRYRK